MNCRHCGRTIVKRGGVWIDPNAKGDDRIWRETCDSHDTFTAEHEPKAERRTRKAKGLVVKSPPMPSWDERCRATSERLGCNLSGRLNAVQRAANEGRDKDAREELIAILGFFRGAYVRHVQRYRRHRR